MQDKDAVNKEMTGDSTAAAEVINISVSPQCALKEEEILEEEHGGFNLTSCSPYMVQSMTGA